RTSAIGTRMSALRNLRITRALGCKDGQRSPGTRTSAGRVLVQPLAHFLAGLEERHMLLLDGDMRAGARIAPGARRAVLYREGAEAAQLDAVAMRQRRDDLAEDRVDDVLDVTLVKMRVLRRDSLDEFRLDHRCGRPP